MNPILSASATSLARAIRSGQVSSEEVVRTYLDRIAAVNPQLNAVVQLAEGALVQAEAADRRLARGEAVGPLHGVPVTIKDSLYTAGIISTGGMVERRAFVPEEDATAVARLRAAGAIVLGKTNLPELTLHPETFNDLYGRTNNPYDLSRSPGGSSGGEGAIIAAGGSPLGLGGDAGGSIRMPCHFCGIAGIVPTPGRVPGTGQNPPNAGAYIKNQVGPMSRHVEDLYPVLALIQGPDGCDAGVAPVSLGNPAEVDISGLRIAFYTDNGLWPADEETTAVVERTVQLLADAGAIVEEARPEGASNYLDIAAGLASHWPTTFPILHELFGDVDLNAQTLTEHEQAWQERLQAARSAEASTAAEFFLATIKLDLYKSEMHAFMAGYDAVVCPVCGRPALPHGFSTKPESWHAYNYTQPFSIAGLPAAAVRGGTSAEGLPIGVQVAANPWREDVALAIAAFIEQASGGWQPPEGLQEGA